ncbi:heavy-metal-associated domain-containing protein [Hyunsoonleella flava]|uniref:Heavy-metal-associated domain-containing protein n=1 Tax=Hyunsoonleella flava TaxID=2527939 RepID=A0A4Q9FFL0_9FLAO|nr:heavy metal-associated domain-containing protein [Hyunsoonleella flava]TBN03317.1 heavy-metal-associated domain-containing protein [Hyunsoonleella flava]
MKTIKYIIASALCLLLVTSCKNNKEAEVKTVDVETTVQKQLDPNATYAKAEFTVKGMTCEIGCAATIQKKIAKMDGVKFAKVDFKNELAMVEYDEAKVNPNSLEETVTSVADIYKVSDMKTVEAFSSEAKAKVCKPGCEKDCCKKAAKEGKKMACKADCDKSCCAQKA